MPQQADIRLVCLDLDGTALDADGQHAWLSDALVPVLNRLGGRGVNWCINSGRPHQNQLGLVQACRGLAHMPMALLSGERYIHWLSPRYASHEPFNSQMSEMLHALHPKVSDALNGHRTAPCASFPMKHELEVDDILGWQLEGEEQVPGFVATLDALLTGVGDAQVLRNGAWVIITHRAAGKGIVLEEACRHQGLVREQVLAVGDHHNDLDMLDGRAAASVGCPADADPEVLACVAAAGGTISQHGGAAGTVDILQRLLGLPS